MPKKKDIKQIFENMELESSEAHPQFTESAKPDSRQEASVPDQTKDVEALVNSETSKAEQTDESVEVTSADEGEPTGQEKAPVIPVTAPVDSSPVDSSGQESEDSPDDLLGDVRRSLLEEEAQEQPKWWKRIGKSSRKKNVEEEKTPVVEEINLPPLNALQTMEPETGVREDIESDEYQDQLDELIDMLDVDDEPLDENPAPVQVEIPVEPEKPADIEDLKKQAFQSRPAEAEDENLTEVRAIALEGGEEVFVEVEAKPQDPLQERLSAAENALKPYQRYINFAFAFLGFIMAVTAAFLIYNAYQRSLAQQAAVVEVSNLPFPTSVKLPGGWSFNLGKGALQDGSWNPAGAEWLQGTEVCRWVALPYSRQLEAVVRTLNPDDPIELGMSNNDLLTYKVYSIRQMSPEEMRELDSNTPCLLIVLAEPEEEKRWVLTALP